MNTWTVVGTQWGDEGKGKITDYLAQNADVVVRYQGGNNAGHTIKFLGKTYALHLIPSGIFKETTMNILGNGMVINPWALLKEVEQLKALGVPCQNLKISEAAHVVMPYHEALDKVYENQKGDQKVGTTFKGIGPAYSDKASRIGIRMCDFIEPKRLHHFLKHQLPSINRILTENGMDPYDIDALYEASCTISEKLKPYIENVGIWLNRAINNNLKVLFEGAQGTMLCLDHGTYPYVTSSSPTAASVALNLGIPPQSIQNVLGVSKAYTTRVGEGFFATEIEGELADKIRIQGNEFGTTTKRPRRIGWLDIVVLKHAKRVNGLTSVAIMLLDVLKGIDTIKICTSYNYEGKVIDTIPASIEEYKKVKPRYIELPGFHEDISDVREYNDLPKEAKNYIETIERLLEVPVGIISIGPSREQTLLRQSYFK